MTREQLAAPSDRRAVWIPIGFGLMMLLLSPLHRVFSEWGGTMQYFAGREIVAGLGYHGWTSHFWPPLFSLCIGIAGLVLPGFFAGKLISILCGAIVLYLIYRLAELISGQRRIAIWAQAFVALNPLFVYESLQSHNHMLESVCFIGSLWLFLRSLEQPTPARLIVAGLAGGLAGLSRYSSYVLLFMPLALFALFEFKKAAKLAAGYWCGFALISSPWWYLNTAYNGSPLNSWQYLNMCGAVFRSSDAGLSMRGMWDCLDRPEIRSALDLMIRHPKEYLKNLLENLPECIMAVSAGSLGLFTVPAILESFLSLPSRYWLVMAGEMALSVLVVSQLYVAPWYLLCWAILMCMITVIFVCRYLGRLEDSFGFLRRVSAGRNLLLVLLILSGLMAAREMRGYYLESETYYPLWDAAEVSDALRKHDPHISSKIVMALDPARAYYAGAKYLSTPLEYTGTVEGMLSYQGLATRFLHYAPRYPATIGDEDLRADYLVYTNPEGIPSRELHEQPQFSFLMDPSSDRIPGWFKLVYRSKRVVVYEIDWKDRHVK
jgi:hypothetical protein